MIVQRRFFSSHKIGVSCKIFISALFKNIFAETNYLNMRLILTFDNGAVCIDQSSICKHAPMTNPFDPFLKFKKSTTAKCRLFIPQKIILNSESINYLQDFLKKIS